MTAGGDAGRLVGESQDALQLRKGELGQRVELHQLHWAPPNVIPEAVPAHPADEGGLRLQPGGGHRLIRRSAAGVGVELGDALLCLARLGEIDQHFADGGDVSPVCFPPLFSYRKLL